MILADSYEEDRGSRARGGPGHRRHTQVGARSPCHWRAISQGDEGSTRVTRDRHRRHVSAPGSRNRYASQANSPDVREPAAKTEISWPRRRPLNVSGLVQTDGGDGEVMFDAKFKLAAASLIRAALVEDFDMAELIISQHDPYEPTRAMAVISAQGWTITNGYSMAPAVESLDVLALVFAGEAGADRRELPR
jgi:hypothetical protein